MKKIKSLKQLRDIEQNAGEILKIPRKQDEKYMRLEKMIGKHESSKNWKTWCFK